jgi:uncharacterized protein YjdB
VEMRHSVLLILVAVSAFASACGSVCTTELRVHTTPADTTIRVGQAFTASVQLSTCGGDRVLSDVFMWQSESASIATVEPATGRVAGQASGETRITHTSERYGATGEVRVTVIETSP